MRNSDSFTFSDLCIFGVFLFMVFIVARNILSSFDLSCLRTESSQINCTYKASRFFGIEQDSPMYMRGVSNTIIYHYTKRGGGQSGDTEISLLMIETSNNVLTLPENPNDSEAISIKINKFLRSQEPTLEITWNNYWSWVFPMLLVFLLILIIFIPFIIMWYVDRLRSMW